MGYLVMARLPVLYWLDIMAPSLALGLAFGRMGCFLNGCCYGAACHLGSWGITWPAGSIPWFHYAEAYAPKVLDQAAGGYGATMGALAATWQPPTIYPSQILALVGGLLLFAFLHFLFQHKRRHGQVLLVFFILYGLGRFFEEALRADEEPAYLLGLPTLLRAFGHEAAAAGLRGLTISQNVAILMVAGAAIALWQLMRSKRRAWNADYAPPAPVLAGDGPPRGAPHKKPPKSKKKGTHA
jgi:prolipoprotein diacylglyceryltransferase